MKRVLAMLVWGVLIFAIGTYLDKVREMLMLGGDPVMVAVVRFAAGLVLVVLVVLLGRWLRRWRGKRMEPGEWFVAGAVAWVIQGLYVWWLAPRQTLDIVVHDTYYVFAYIHAVTAVAVIFGTIGAIYLVEPERRMNRVLGYLHFWVSMAALYVVLWMENVKYVDVLQGSWGFGRWGIQQAKLHQVVDWAYTGLAILLVAVQILFVGNLFAMLFGGGRRKGRRRAADGKFQ